MVHFSTLMHYKPTRSCTDDTGKELWHSVVNDLDLPQILNGLLPGPCPVTPLDLAQIGLVLFAQSYWQKQQKQNNQKTDSGDQKEIPAFELIAAVPLNAGYQINSSPPLSIKLHEVSCERLFFTHAFGLVLSGFSVHSISSGL